MVPDDKLLIWNIKDGWDPLCKFLGKPVPNSTLPRENTAKDTDFWDMYVFRNCSIRFSIRYYIRSVPIYWLSLIISYAVPIYMLYKLFCLFLLH